MPEKIEKPMSETSILEKAETEKRQRESSPGASELTELSKRRELAFPSDKLATKPSILDLDTQQSGFRTAKGFGSIQSTVNIFDEANRETATRIDPATNETDRSTDAKSPEVKKTDSTKGSVVPGGFASAGGFRSFADTSAFASTAKSGGFSSLLSSGENGSAGFSSLLDADQKGSIFDKDPVDKQEAGDEPDEEAPDGDAAEQPIDEQQYVAVKGLEKTTVPTGEEGEHCLHSIRAKLYAIDPRNVDDGWKERGVGTLRVLKDQVERTRLVMRADAVFRVMLNMPLHPQYKLEDGGDSMGEKTIRIFGIEDGMGIWLALRVGSQKAAQETKGIIEDCIRNAPFQAHSTDLPESESTTPTGSTTKKSTHTPQDKVQDEQAEGTETLDSVEQTELAKHKEILKEKESFEESKPKGST